VTAESIGRATHGAADDVSTGRVFARTCAAEWTRLWTVKTSWWFLGTATVMMVGLGTALGFEAAADPVHLQGEPAWQTAKNLAVPAQFALLAFALTAVTSDYASGGIVPTLQWTPRRAVLFSVRTIVTVAAAAGFGVLLALSSALAAFATAGSAMILPLDEGLEMLATVALVFASGSALAVGLGFLLRNTAGALVSAFMLLLVLPVLLPQLGLEWLTTLADRLPGSGALFFLAAERDSRGITEASATITLLAWAVCAGLLGWLRLTRDDASR
jgi:hypothetical protein